MRKKKFIILVFLIALLGFFLRLWQLGSAPISLHWDEASLGYNAFSILKTGRDEYGNLFPLIFKSFGDYKPGFYVYLAAVSEAIFGLNEFAVRLPSALFGALGIFLLFLVVNELFSDFRARKMIALIASFVLATSPWHYHYSHGAWEVNVFMTFLLLGIWLFLRGVKKPDRFLFFSALSFGASFYLYQGAKMLVPLVAGGLILFSWRKVFKASRRMILSSALILALMALPIYFSAFLGGAGGRLKIMSLFSYPRQIEEAEKIAQEAGVMPQSLEFKIFHGPLNYYARGMVGRYLNHFSGRFLFFEGDWSNPRHSVPHAGVLNHLAILLLPLGAYCLVSRKIKNQNLLWYWLLIGPLPAALTRDVVQATRAYFLVFPLAIITAFGIWFAFQFIKGRFFVFKWGIILFLGCLWLFSFGFYLDQFFIHAPIAYSEAWPYGYKETVNFIEDKTDNYDQVVCTQKYGQPYIYYLFYTAYDPQKYQVQAKLIEHPEGDVGRVEEIDNIKFQNLYWPSDRFKKNTLYIGATYEIPQKDILEDEAKVLKDIYFLNGVLAFRIVETVK
jgi:4-amino-4-deoxy-L-arabinose transferase-like glycosyltransferase